MPGPVTILIVDDEPGMLITLKDILDALGYAVITVEDGYQAIEVVKKETIDVALMDFKMPGINGVETFKQIEKIDPSIKTIFITAYYDERILSEALAEGVIGICNKPLDIPQLLDHIKASVGG
jgi:two-component system response regulator HydG